MNRMLALMEDPSKSEGHQLDLTTYRKLISEDDVLTKLFLDTLPKSFILKDTKTDVQQKTLGMRRELLTDSLFKGVKWPTAGRKKVAPKGGVETASALGTGSASAGSGSQTHVGLASPLVKEDETTQMTTNTETEDLLEEGEFLYFR